MRTDYSRIATTWISSDDVDLEKKLAEWELFYNYDRPHGAHRGRAPYEALRAKLP